MLAMDEHTTFTLGVAAACVAGTVAVMKLLNNSSSTPAAAVDRFDEPSVCFSKKETF